MMRLAAPMQILWHLPAILAVTGSTSRGGVVLSRAVNLLTDMARIAGYLLAVLTRLDCTAHIPRWKARSCGNCRPPGSTCPIAGSGGA
jgi:hypothetical protein